MAKGEPSKQLPALPKGYTPFFVELVRLELQGGRSSMVLAVNAAIHLNSMLHTLGLIDDDAWNNSKGFTSLFASAENFATFAGAANSVLKTLVEGGAGTEEEETKRLKILADLAAVESANAAEATD